MLEKKCLVSKICWFICHKHEYLKPTKNVYSKRVIIKKKYCKYCNLIYTHNMLKRHERSQVRAYCCCCCWISNTQRKIKVDKKANKYREKLIYNIKIYSFNIKINEEPHIELLIIFYYIWFKEFLPFKNIARSYRVPYVTIFFFMILKCLNMFLFLLKYNILLRFYTKISLKQFFWCGQIIM